MLLLLCVVALAAEDMPSWVLPGILAVETRSYYQDDGSIHYTDKRRGKAGEYGPFQMTRAAFRQVSRRGEPFWKLETDRVYAEDLAVRYLYHLRDRASSWEQAVQWYNRGPHHRATAYLRAVKRAGGAP